MSDHDPIFTWLKDLLEYLDGRGLILTDDDLIDEALHEHGTERLIDLAQPSPSLTETRGTERATLVLRFYAADNVRDLFADLALWCVEHQVNFAEELRIGLNHAATEHSASQAAGGDEDPDLLYWAESIEEVFNEAEVEG